MAEPDAMQTQPALDRKRIRAWCLYDFGNSGFAVLFPAFFGVYYATTVVPGGEHAGDAYWGNITALYMLLVALSSPFLGGIADHAGVRKRMLFAYTLVAVITVFALASVQPGMVVWGFALAVIAGVAFEGGVTFYNAYLPDIAPPSHHGRVSARGFAWGYAGSFFALLAAAVCFRVLEWWAGVWIFAALQWGLASVALFRRMPPDRPTGMTVLEAGRRGVASTWRTARWVWSQRPLRWFLLGYFFYMDGVITAVHFASLYAKRTLAFSNTELLVLLAIVQVTALVGAAIMARPTDERGPRWTVRILCLWWVGVVVLAYVATDKIFFFVVAALAGLGLGSIQSASRAFMSRMIPDGREAELFGFYALCGKSGAILGPLLFGQLSSAFGNQRPAVLVVGVLYLVGLALVSRVPADAVGAPPRA